MKINRAFVLHRGSHQRSAQAGYVLITVTLAMLVLLGFAGLAIDIAHLEHVKRRMQTAADAGALGGGWELARGRSETEITNAALNDSSQNGFTNLDGDITVEVYHPPIAPSLYAGDPNAVQVIVRQPNLRTFFMQVLGGGRGAVAARAVAHLGSGNGCMFALNPTARSSLVINGGSDLNLGCGIIVDSNSNSALNVNGCSATVDATLIGVTGGVSDNCNVLDQPVTGLLPAPDPLRNLEAPTVGPCDHTGIKITGGTVTLTPGVYCGGIAVSGGTVNFAPGTYILNGGGFNVTGGAMLSGTGTTFYNTGTFSTYQKVSIAGTSTSTFYAPTEGTYKGMLFFGCVLNASGACDRSLAPRPSELDNSFGGTSGSSFNGVLYFPKSNVKFAGTPGSVTSNIAIISDKIEISGTVNFSGDYSALPGGLAYRIAVLGE